MAKIRESISEATTPALSAVELESYIPVPAAAKIKGLSPDTYKRVYGHTIRKLSPRRVGVKLRDALGK
jgi:hypothetical protein